MRAYRGRALLLALPLKSVVQRFAFALLVGAALTVMILSRAEPRLGDNMRGAVSDAAAPILEFFSHPAASFASLIEDVEAVLDVHEENALLEEQNAALRKWQSVAEQMSRENEELRRMLHVVPDPEANSLGIPALAVFPQTPPERKTPDGDEALNPDNLVCQAVPR